MAQVAEQAKSKDKTHGLNIGVLVKQVPVPKEMKTGADGLMDRSGKSMINPHCNNALEEALALKDKMGGTITIFSMGPPNFEQSLDEAMRKGADRAFLLSDRKLAGSDTWATAEALSYLIRYVQKQDGDKPVDVLFAGLQTIDGDTAHVGPQVAARLGFKQVTYVQDIEPENGKFIVKRVLEGGHQKVRVGTPVMFSVHGSANYPRGPSLNYSLAAMEKSMTMVDIATIGLPDEKAGVPGSPTVVSRVRNVVVERGETTYYNEGSMDEKLGKMFEDLEEAIKAEDEDVSVDESGEEVLDERELKKRERDKDMPWVDLREGARGVAVWCQTDGEVLSDAALELLGEARRIATRLDEDSRTVTGVVIGPKTTQHAQKLIHHGADQVYVIEDARFQDYQTLPYTKAICQAAKKINPEIFLFSASTIGRDLAPRVAAILDVGLSADCTEFGVGYYSSRKKNQRFPKAFQMNRPSFGESKLATIIGPWTYPQMATARPGTFRSLAADTSRTGEIINFQPEYDDFDWSIEVIETVQSAASVEVDKADILVAGGMGVGSKGIDLLQELVDAIKANGQNAELAASRALVDAGYVDHDHQVGQTGKTVRPIIYIAAGISGAIQHAQGMKDSYKIIAINTDPEANIWGLADFGFVDDFQKVIPAMIDKVKAGYKFPLEHA